MAPGGGDVGVLGGRERREVDVGDVGGLVGSQDGPVPAVVTGGTGDTASFGDEVVVVLGDGRCLNEDEGLVVRDALLNGAELLRDAGAFGVAVRPPADDVGVLAVVADGGVGFGEQLSVAVDPGTIGLAGQRDDRNVA